MPNSEQFEVAIVGGGPAGLSCGVWLGRFLHSTVLIDAGDPRNWESTGVNGFLGLPGVRPPDLRARGREQCRRYGVELVDACVQRIDQLDAERFDVVLEQGRCFTVRRVVLAFGLHDVWPDLPGLEHCYGLSAHHCPDCDGYDTRGKRAVVFGHGRKAAALAFALTCWTSEIIICTNGKPAGLDRDNLGKLKALNIPIVETGVRSAESQNRHLRWLELEDGTRLSAEKLFFTVYHQPADNLGAALGCARDDDGLLIVDETRRTSVPNVFAAGDITPGPQLAITAAADGAIAAVAIHRSLLPAERRLS
jgi:thioredoxin reductase